jgi:hypothetical protein
LRIRETGGGKEIAVCQRVIPTPEETRSTGREAPGVPKLSQSFHTGPGWACWVIYIILLSFWEFSQTLVLALATSRMASK